MTGSSQASPRRADGANAGVTLIELLVALALIAVIAGVTIPAFRPLLNRRAVDAAAAWMAGELARARHLALARGRHVGMVFDRSAGRDQFSVYEDGGRRGIRSAEVLSGVDPIVRGPEDIGARFPGVRLGIPADPPIRKIPPSGGMLPPGGDPIRFGSADIISFSPTGESSTGSIYLTAEGAELRAVVLYGRTGRIRVWRYFPESHLWRQ